MSLARRIWLPAAYYLSWLFFGLGGLAFSVACAPWTLLPRADRLAPRARAVVRRLFGAWLGWIRWSGVIHVVFKGFEALPTGGVVYVANHPSLVDAPFLLSLLPDTLCVFKPALLRNPVTGPAARLCGYLAADNGVDGIRLAAASVSQGKSLLIFPEGTRTNAGAELNTLRPGFALIARRADAPVQIIRVHASPLLARKGHAWWRLPPLPARFEFTLGEAISADGPAAALTQQVASLLHP